MTRVRVAGSLLVAALVIAGCDSEEEPDGFREGYAAAVTRLSEAQSEIAQDEKPSNREIAADFRRTAAIWEQTRADMSKLEPPEDAGPQLDALLAALEGGVADLRAAARAARSNDPEAFEEARDSLSESSEAVSEAEQRLKKAVDAS